MTFKSSILTPLTLIICFFSSVPAPGKLGQRHIFFFLNT